MIEIQSLGEWALMRRRGFREGKWIGIGVLLTLIIACGAKIQPLPQVQVQPPPPAKFEVSVEASPTINRDPNGDPLSVVIRLYQLKDKGEFSKLTFDVASSGRTDQELMGADFLGKEEFVMVPGAKYAKLDEVTPGTKFVGIVAFFRKPDPNYWRYLVSVDQLMQPQAQPQSAATSRSLPTLAQVQSLAQAPGAVRAQAQSLTQAPAMAQGQAQAFAQSSLTAKAQTLSQAQIPTAPAALTSAQALAQSEALQRKNKRGRKVFDSDPKDPVPPDPKVGAKAGDGADPAKPLLRTPFIPKMGTRLAFLVEDCYLKLIDLKPEPIPGQPENEKPDCGSEAVSSGSRPR